MKESKLKIIFVVIILNIMDGYSLENQTKLIGRPNKKGKCYFFI